MKTETSNKDNDVISSSSYKEQLDLLNSTYNTLATTIEGRMILLLEKEAKYTKLQELMKHNAAIAKQKIKLDVGGTTFTTSRTTLLRFEDTYFHAMLTSGLWQPDEDGVYFIDRNPKYFGIILDYLRSGKMDLSDFHGKQIEQLKEELDYYLIPVPIPPVTIPSKILDEKRKSDLMKMLPATIKEFRLILNSTERGTTSQVFDTVVKGLSNTLILIQANTGYVFGAYVVDRWGEKGGWIKGSLDNFLFTLGNGRTNPTKLLHSGNGNGIHISGCGVHLGSDGDLVAFCSHSCSNPGTYTKVAPGYSGTLCSSLLAGASSWTPIVMEVFVGEGF